MYVYIVIDIYIYTYIHTIFFNDHQSFVARLRVKDGSLLQQADFANALKDPWRFEKVEKVRVVYQQPKKRREQKHASVAGFRVSSWVNL